MSTGIRNISNPRKIKTTTAITPNPTKTDTSAGNAFIARNNKASAPITAKNSTINITPENFTMFVLSTSSLFILNVLL